MYTRKPVATLTAFVAFLQWGVDELIGGSAWGKVRIPLRRKAKMTSLTPLHWLILALIALLVFAGFEQIRSGLLQGRRKRLPRPPERRRFLEGMSATTSLALAGAMLLALGLLVDVYGPDWTPGAVGENLSLALSGSGAVLTLLSFYLARRSRGRRG